MKKLYLTVLCLCGLLVTVGQAELNVQALIENSKQYDNTYVELRGEAIGDIMVRPVSGKNNMSSKSWVNVLTPEGNAIGILGRPAEINKIEHLGNYNYRGDEVLVKGIFHRFFKDQGGETMIEAYTVDILRPGYPTPHPVPIKKIIFAVFLTLLAGALLTYQLYISRKRSRGK